MTKNKIQTIYLKVAPNMIKHKLSVILLTSLMLLTTNVSTHVQGESPAEKGLYQMAELEKKQGKWISAISLSLGVGSLIAAPNFNDTDHFTQSSLTKTGVLCTGIGLWRWVTPSKAEKAYNQVQSMPLSNREEASIKALYALDKYYNKERIYGTILSAISTPILFPEFFDDGGMSFALVISLTAPFNKSYQERKLEKIIKELETKPI